MGGNTILFGNRMGMLVRISNNIYYLCSFSQGGRGTEATVLLWFARLFTPLISLVVTKCVRPLRGRLLLTPTAAGYVPLALHPRL